jgi:2-hydroxychromene-2-carboxylate isomerase
MIASIDVFFEFASPYSYLAAQELPALAQRHGRPLRWRPIDLAKVWRELGVLEPYRAVRRVKVGYIWRDAARVAADRGLQLVPSQSLPDTTLARLVVHRLNRYAPAAVEPFVLEVWRKLMAEGAAVGSVDTLMRCLDSGLHSEIQAAHEESEAAEDLEIANRDAVAGGCFGVPWITADGEVYFGQDRLYLLDRRLTQAAGVVRGSHLRETERLSDVI